MSAAERLLCIDYGSKFTGLAVADFPGITARALHTIDASRVDPVRAIATAVSNEKVTRILIGYPFSDIEGDIHAQIKAFRSKIETALPGMRIDFVDESYSSQEADALLAETGLGRKKKHRAQDSEAAKLVLLRYLREHNNI